jgi:hypothetical protein
LELIAQKKDDVIIQFWRPPGLLERSSHMTAHPTPMESIGILRGNDCLLPFDQQEILVTKK